MIFDVIISRIRDCFPEVVISQLQVKHPGADDEGLWFFNWPGRNGEIQLESPFGMCPFIIEHDRMKSSSDAWRADTIDDAVAKVSGYFESLPLG